LTYPNLSPECYSNIFLQEAGYDYLGQMKLYSEDDKKSIYWSLNRIFDFDDSQINQAILYQAGIQDSSRDAHPNVAAAFFPIGEGLLAPVAWVHEQWDKLVNMASCSGAR
jgi:hypothetical protein